MPEARALGTAFELGLIDYLSENQQSTIEELQKRFEIDGQGLHLLVNLLLANGVIEERNGEIRLSRQFEETLAYEDLLRAKLEFANLAAADFTDLFTTLIRDPGRFGRHARIFQLFNYRRCFDYSPENYEFTKRWMRITTALTRYEAQVCMTCHDFSGHERMLDIGGNSGEFALQVCRKYPGISATVFDLPLVCQIGEENVDSQPEGRRITFIRGNAFVDEFPTGFDLITFKSMLHDWPEKETKELIFKATRSLKPGGTLLIFERGPIELGKTIPPYSMVPFLLFFRSFRSPHIYETQLKELDFRDINVQRIELETPFFLVTGTKGT